MKKMVFLDFVSHDRLGVFADTPAKGTFLTLTIQTVSICNDENSRGSIRDLLYLAARP